MTRRIPREEGIFVGNSAGAAMAGLLQMNHMFKPSDVVVVIFHDHGTRYLGKMFNEDWMRDRGFLEIKKPKAIDLITSHKNKKLLTIDAEATVNDALMIMNKYGISQIPVTKGVEFVGSLNDNYLFSKLIEDSNIKNKIVKEIMQAPFPIVSPQAPMEDVSKLITKENNAVLMTDLSGTNHIITKHDLIQGISQINI
jgi:cystathionine beta-synthase